jgi:hypothetical protein
VPNPSPLALGETAPHSLRARILLGVVQAFDPHGAPATDGTGLSKVGRGLREEVENALPQTRRLLPPTEVPHESTLVASRVASTADGPPRRTRPGLGCLMTPHPAVRMHARDALD